MPWVVVVHKDSPSGQALIALKQYDQIYLGHPVVLCSEADISHPIWLKVETPKNKGKGFLYFPHASLVMLAEGAQAERDFGFRPSPEAA